MISRISPFCPVARPVLSMVFPYRLKFQYLGLHNAHRRLILTRAHAQSRQTLGTNDFSTRSGQERKGSSFGNDVRAGSSKSLIEDEADLSDWVSSLSSNSFKKTKMYSDSEEDNVESRGSRGRERYGKRRRKSDFDKDLDLTSRRSEGSRSSSKFGAPGRRAEGSRKRESFSGGWGDDSRTRTPFSGRQDQGSRAREPFSGRRKNDNEFKTSLDGRDRVGRFGGRSEEKRGGRNSEFLRRGYEDRVEKRQNGGGREMQYGKGKDRGSDRGNLGRERGGKAMGRMGLPVTDDEETEEVEEEEDKGYKNFKELLDSDEVDDDEDDEGEEVEVVEEGGGGLFEKGTFSPKSSQALPGGSDSYLSESR